LSFGVVAVRFLLYDVDIESGESFETLIAKFVSGRWQVSLNRHN